MTTEYICPMANTLERCKNTSKDGLVFICHHSETHEHTAGCEHRCCDGAEPCRKVSQE